MDYLVPTSFKELYDEFLDSVSYDCSINDIPPKELAMSFIGWLDAFYQLPIPKVLPIVD